MQGDEPLNMRKLFIGGLPHDATDETLQEYFSKYGSVVNSSVVKDSVTKRSRGFGFVIFSSSKMADDAQAARPHVINGKEVDTKRAIPKSDMDSTYKNHSNIQEKRVFIGGLRGSTTSEILNTHFSTYGVVESVDLILDPNTHRNRGFAYIAFDDSDSAGKVILQKYHVIDGRKCEAKPAFQKQQRYPHSHQMDGGYGAMGSYGSYAGSYMNYMDPCYQPHKSCCDHYHHHHHRGSSRLIFFL
ncbi:hypothetical protein HELRODRAFT_72414 [Helobdella robusta]|uniref:RRM domain-containing protein n=1 Tax=Helobdella robusta TaxID=6412 RepID=T1G0Z7_HELRO|nr:hypothetical protein HELRODRAFT_72414 [Helobdella robusta]ESO10744.1 hypothetical protein HELRODRAFT_72414 [Helobdella robusta]